MDGIQFFAYCSCLSFFAPIRSGKKPRLIFPWPSSSTAPCPSNLSFSWCSAANKTVTSHFTHLYTIQEYRCSKFAAWRIKSLKSYWNQPKKAVVFVAQVLSRQDVLAGPTEVGNGTSGGFVTVSAVALLCFLRLVSHLFSHLWTARDLWRWGYMNHHHQSVRCFRCFDQVSAMSWWTGSPKPAASGHFGTTVRPHVIVYEFL